MTILDSGERREFDSGAVRDIQFGKGRCDLLPLDVIANLCSDTTVHNVLAFINDFVKTGDTSSLYFSLFEFIKWHDWSFCQCVLEVSKHYEEGCRKYGERNWEKGIPVHCYIDSAIRHLLKYFDYKNTPDSKWNDEPHDRAFVWNILGAIWTCTNMPALNDYPVSR